MQQARKNIAVVFGGMSSENEISVITGTMTANVAREKYEVFPVFLSQGGRLYTGKALFDVSSFRGGIEGKADEALFLNGKLYSVRGKKLKEIVAIDCGINCCHGTGGEDGLIAALFSRAGIPNASPGIAGSALFMDKSLTKLAAKALGVKSAPYMRIGEAEYAKRAAMALRCVEERLGYPVIVKPARLGSSIGVLVAENRGELVRAIQSAFEYDTVVLAEKYLAGSREINCAAYKRGGEILLSECEEPLTSHKILTFRDKYIGGGKERAHIFPAQIPEALSARVKGYTKLLYRKFDLRGVVRADYLIYKGEVYFNEMNTVPGSLAYYLFSDSLAGFSGMLGELVEQGIADSAAAKRKRLLKNCGVLTSIPSKGGKRGI